MRKEENTMQLKNYHIDQQSYAKCIEVSKRVRWDIDNDVIRGREFDFSQKFLPDGISKVEQLQFLNDDEKRLLSQIQGRTYANMFGFVERFITAKVLETTRDHWLGNQTALEALIRFSDEELKHQALFRRIEKMMADGMPKGYKFLPDPDAVAAAVLKNSTWAVLALILEIELFTQEHYKQSIEPEKNLSDLYKDIFLFHWKEETTHAMMDELEWPREDSKLSAEERDRAIDELIAIVVDVDGILQNQSAADVDYFTKVCDRSFTDDEVQRIKDGVLKAYRWQYIFSGVEHPRFQKLYNDLTTEDQRQHISAALATLN
jgi:DNA-binding Lrp family transcriptional regulator